MSKIPAIFDNGSIYFPEKSPFSVCDHHINSGDETAKITIRLHNGVANMWEVTGKLKPYMSQEDIETKVKFPASRQIPGRETKNFHRFTVEGGVEELAKLVIGLGGSLEHGPRLADRSPKETGARTR